MKKRKTMKKIIALLLTVIIVICSLPMTAFANTLESTFLESENKAVNEGNENWHLIDEQEIVTDEIIGNVSEVESLREENVKHFRLADGTYEAIVYSQPVHRKDEDGVWQDIDNTIELKTYAKGSKYATRDSRVTFADRFTNNAELFTLSENGYSISMQLLSDGNEFDNEMETTDFGNLSTPIVNNRSEKRTSTIFNSIDEAKKIDNKSSIVYNNIRKNINIEYVLNGNDVKENIIVNAPCESYEYIFQITLDGLFAELSNNGEIFVKDNTTKDTEYIIPAPYMYDANGTYSYDVSYTLEQVKDEIYLLVVSADSEWINAEDRAFPVVVDPTIRETIVYDSYVDELNPNDNYGLDDDLWVSDTDTTYMKIDIPELPTGATFNSAYLYVPYYYHISTGYLSAAVYRVLSYWQEHTITYNNAPALGDIICTDMLIATSSITESSPGTASFHLTSVVEEWYNGASNYGIAIKRRDSSLATNQSVILKSFDAYEEESYLSINYVYSITEGVYAFENNLYTNHWITVEGNGESIGAGSYIQHSYSDVSPASTSVFDRSSLFKISRAGGQDLYIIRSMLNNNLTFGVSGTEIITKEIPSADSDVALADTFHIEWDGNAFLIRPYNSLNVIEMYSDDTTNLAMASREYASDSAEWNLSKYTGQQKGGGTLYYPKNITEGEPATFSAVVWSTSINVNSAYLYVDEAYENIATSVWYPETKRLITYPQEDGIYVINVDIQNNSQTFYTVSFTRTIVQNTDPLYKDNISFVRYTDITTNRSSHLLTVIGSNIGADDTFIVRNMNNQMSRSFYITDALINELNELEAAYHSHLLPYFQSSIEEAAAHAAKEETDQLVDDGYITYNSSEYYGAWASNYNEELNIVHTLTQFVRTYTAIYGVYMAATNFYYSQMYSNIYTVSSTQYKSTVSQIDDIASQLTNRPGSTKVMLGTTTDATTWYSAGESQNMTYFYTPDWDDYVALYGDDMMQAANKQFLQTQKMAGKEFWFSHDPMQTLLYYPESSFAMELNWLKEAYGLTELTAQNFVQYGSYWYFVP